MASTLVHHAPNGSLGSAVSPLVQTSTAPPPLRVRLFAAFQLDFSSLDALDLGTPEQIDAEICELFERGTHVRGA